MAIATKTITGGGDSLNIIAYDEDEPRDGPALLPNVWAPPMLRSEVQAIVATATITYVGPGHVGTPGANTFTDMAALRAGAAGLGVADGDDLVIYFKAGVANMYTGTETGPDGFPTGWRTGNGFRPGPGHTLVLSTEWLALPAPDANVKYTVPNIASRFDPTPANIERTAFIQRPSGGDSCWSIDHNTRKWQIIGLQAAVRLGDVHPVVYMLSWARNPSFTNIPEDIHHQQCFLDGGGIDSQPINPGQERGVQYGTIVRGRRCSFTDGYIAGCNAEGVGQPRESCALIHGQGDGFLYRNMFGQASSIQLGSGFEEPADGRLRAQQATFEYGQMYRENFETLNTTELGVLCKGGFEAKQAWTTLVQCMIGQGVTTGSHNSKSRDSTNVQLVGFKGTNNSPRSGGGGMGHTQSVTARYMISDGYPLGAYAQNLGGTDIESYGMERWSFHNHLHLRHGADAANAGGDSVYQSQSKLLTISSHTDPAGRTGPRNGSYLGITQVPSGANKMRHLMFLSGPTVYDPTSNVFADIIAGDTDFGISQASHNDNGAFEPGGAFDGAAANHFAFGAFAPNYSGTTYFMETNMETYLDANGDLTTAGKAAWRAYRGLGSGDPICSQIPRMRPDGTMYTPAADQPGYDSVGMKAFCGGSDLTDIGAGLKSPTIRYP